MNLLLVKEASYKGPHVGGKRGIDVVNSVNILKTIELCILNG